MRVESGLMQKLVKDPSKSPLKLCHALYPTGVLPGQ